MRVRAYILELTEARHMCGIRIACININYIDIVLSVVPCRFVALAGPSLLAQDNIDERGCVSVCLHQCI